MFSLAQSFLYTCLVCFIHILFSALNEIQTLWAPLSPWASPAQNCLRFHDPLALLLISLPALLLSFSYKIPVCESAFLASSDFSGVSIKLHFKN